MCTAPWSVARSHRPGDDRQIVVSPSRLPVTLLGGYLGAGKTTLVNRLLAETDRRLVVLVNDVGAVDVDASLIAQHDGQTLTLTNGCVCCSITDDLGPVLEHVRSMVAGPTPPEQVVMELSGVAEPARVAPWAKTTGFELDGIVVAADAEQIADLSARRFVGDTVRTQLESADLVLLTKTDLVADRGVAARRFVARHTGAPIVDASDIEANAVFGRGGAIPDVAAVGDRHETRLVDVAGLTRAELEQVVDSFEAIRAKGLVRCVDSNAPFEVQVVGRRRSVRLRPDLAHRDTRSVLVVIDLPDEQTT
jgi:G3E family GTPase